MVSALGIKNPGMTAAPYLVERMTDLLRDEGLETRKRQDFQPRLKRKKAFSAVDASGAETDAEGRSPVCQGDMQMWRKSQKEIFFVFFALLCLRRVSTVFKKRLRTGMGRCQGAFCTSRILEIVCRETG